MPRMAKSACQLSQAQFLDKAEPLKSVFTGPSDPSKYPSQLICPTTGLLVWYLDVAAIAGLTAGFNPSWCAS